MKDALESGLVEARLYGEKADIIHNAAIVVGTAAPIILPSRASDPKSKYASLALGVLLS